jgi:hypothetical protein
MNFFNFLSEFRDDERGSLAIETVLIFPILCWAYLATFVYFDAFRIQSTTNKAAYTISDQVSRETGYITPNYMTSLYNLHEFLTSSNHPTKLRLSIVRYTDDDGYEVRWSQGRGGAGALNDAGLADILDKLPVMPDNEVIIVIQNWLSYEPMFSVGLKAFEFENLIVTRPRFNSAQLCWNSVENGGVSTATC